MSQCDIDAPRTEPSSESYRDWKTWNEKDFGLCAPITARYFDAELARAGIRIEADMPLLELGFGNGSFAAWAHARHCDYSGTELDPELVDRAIDHGWKAFPATLALDTLALSKPPCCILAWDVLEHLTTAQIMEVLSSAARILTDGGVFLARLPSGDSPFSGHIQHGDITHCTSLGSSAVRQLATMAGLCVMQIRAPVLPLRGIGLRRWLRRIPVVVMRALTTRLIRTLFHDNQPTVITANMLVVLRKNAEHLAPHTTAQSNR